MFLKKVPYKWITYKNKEYNFTISYPEYLSLTTTPRKTYLLGDDWTANMTGNYKTGNHNIIEIPIIESNLRSGGPYYYAVVRVGVSSNPIALKKCYGADFDTKRTPVNINGRMFHVFEFSDAAMSQVLDGKSYRFKRNGLCYAVEFVETSVNIYELDKTDPREKILIDYLTELSSYAKKEGERIIKTFNCRNS